MIVWRNSTKPMTDEDFERIAKARAKEADMQYVHYEKFLENDHVRLIVTCEYGRHLQTTVLCDYIFPGVKQ
jgi:hypothetical protein